ncbi:MAG: 2-phosphosulfolactate phosphatase [Limisphaerales bacterium]
MSVTASAFPRGIDFDLGNSPREYTPEKVRGKTIVSTTTNGHACFKSLCERSKPFCRSFLNLTATAQFLKQQNFENILLVCAGTGNNAALEGHPGGRSVVRVNDSVGRDSGEPVLADGDHDSRSPHQSNQQFSDSAQIALRTYLEAKPNLAAAMASSENARRLLAIPELRDDVVFCSQRDIFRWSP